VTYRCRLCPKTATGAAQYHPGRWACPKESGYDAGRTTRWGQLKEDRAKAARSVPNPDASGATGATSPGSAPAAPGAGTSAPAPGPSGALQKLELGTRIAETARRDASQPQADKDWLLPAESSQTFFEMMRNGFRMIAHTLDDILQAEKTKEGKIKDDIFELNGHDLAAARGGFGQRFATKIVKALGARTQEEGIATVDSLAFLLMFLGMFLGMASHFWRVAEESPRLAKMRASREKAKSEKEAQIAARLTAEQKAGAVDTTSRPAGGATPG